MAAMHQPPQVPKPPQLPQPVQHNAASMEAQANEVLATRGRSFYWARHLLSARHAARATRLYRFCRHIDDLADETACKVQAYEALDSLRADILSQHSSNPVILDALALMQECAIDPVIVLELVCGVRSDLEQVAIADEPELLRYCYRVAGTVGIMMCHALDVDNPAAFHHAIDLGIGMQLTNICRDVAEDASLGRRYLPATLVGDCAPATLLRPDAPLRGVVTHAVGSLLNTAEKYYRSGEDGLRYLPSGARAGILVAARLYRAIGRRQQRRNCDYWTRRVIVRSPAKLALTLQALAELTIGRADFLRNGLRGHSACHGQHDALLHASLAGLPHTESIVAASHGG